MITPPTVRWRKSSHSGDQGGECVEVTAFPSGAIAVRDSKHPDDPCLTLSRHAFRTLLDHATTNAARR